MFKQFLPALIIWTALCSGVVWAPASAAAENAQKQATEPICGARLMTRPERRDHMARMRSAKTAEEREHIRAEHYEAMQARAKQRGVTLPDTSRCGAGPMGRQGMGRGMGMGSGPGRETGGAP